MTGPFDKPEQQHHLLVKAVHRYRRAGLARLGTECIMRVLVVVAAAASFAVTIERTASLPPWGRIVLVTLVVLSPIAAAAHLLHVTRGCLRARYWLNELSGVDPALGWALRIGLGLWPLRSDRRLAYSPSLIDEGIARAAATASSIPRAPKVRLLPRRRWAVWAPLLAFVAAALCCPRGSWEAVLRLLHPAQMPRLVIRPSLQRVAWGKEAVLEVDLFPVSQGPPTVELSPDSLAWQAAPTLTPRDSIGRFEVRTGSLHQNCYVRARSPLAPEAVARIVVDARLDLARLLLRVHYPAYTGVGTVEIPSDAEEVRALRGSGLEVVVKATSPLALAYLVTGAGDSLEMDLDGILATTTFQVDAMDTLTLALWDSLGQPFESACCAVIPYEDVPPSVAITEPGRDTQVDEEMALPLVVDVKDDFGVSRVRIVWQRGALDGTWDLLQSPRSTRSLRLRSLWDLDEAGLLPGDTLVYWAEAADNDNVGGPKVAGSDTFRVRFPSLSEMLAQTARLHEESADKLEKVSREQEELLGDTDEAGTTQDLTWERKRQAEELVQAQENLLEEIRQTTHALREGLEQSPEEDMQLAQEIAGEVSRLQQLLSELDDPSLRRSMEQLRQALASLDTDAVRKAAQRMTFSQDELLSKLKRTVQVLERLAAEQKLRAALQETLELLSDQEGIDARVARDTLDASALPRQQESLAARAAELGRELEDTAPGLASFSEEAEHTVAEQGQTLQQQVAPLSREMADLLAAGDHPGSLAKGVQIESALSQVATSLQEALQSLQQEFGEHVVNSLRDAATKLLDCSMLEEALALRTAQAGRGSPLSQEQVELMETVRSVTKKLEQLGQETFFVNRSMSLALGKSLRTMEQVARHLSVGATKAAQAGAQQAMGNLNLAVREILRAAGQAEQAGSGTGFQQALDRLAGLCQRQAGLNSACQAMLAPQGQPVPSLGDLLAELAAEQEAVRAELRRVAAAAEGRAEVAGPLGAAGREMGEVALRLREKGVSEETVSKQHRILSRMLQATNSLYRQGYRNRRRSEEAKTYPPDSPDATLQELDRPSPGARARMEYFRQECPPEYREYVGAYLRAVLHSDDRKGESAGEKWYETGH